MDEQKSYTALENWNIDSEWYTVKAIVRWLAHKLIRPRFKPYGLQDKTEGYTGWYEIPGFGVTAFVKADGSRQYRW